MLHALRYGLLAGSIKQQQSGSTLVVSMDGWMDGGHLPVTPLGHGCCNNTWCVLDAQQDAQPTTAAGDAEGGRGAAAAAAAAAAVIEEGRVGAVGGPHPGCTWDPSSSRALAELGIFTSSDVTG
jgi:hypothetical protein